VLWVGMVKRGRWLFAGGDSLRVMIVYAKLTGMCRGNLSHFYKSPNL
jgi:hypothetical protein